MIVRNLTIKIQGNRATTDSPLYLHTQDKNIHIAINVTNNKFEIKDDMLLSFTIIKPNGDEVDKADCYIKNKQCHLLLNGAEFDEISEVGQHLIQLKLYDEFRQARLSLPPFAMHILQNHGTYYADDEIEGLQAEQNAYKLMTQNRLALEMNESILISDLPTTTEVAGYVPVTNGDTTYKLDMSQVATKDDVANVTIDLSPYATKEEVNGKADKTHNHDAVYAPKSHTHSQYLTQHQDISHLATKEELEHNHDNQYAPKTHTHSQYLTEHQDISHLASKAYVANAIADAQLNGEGEEIDLSGYATKDDLLAKADKTYVDTYFLSKAMAEINYSTIEHNHDFRYSQLDHTHSGYATTGDLTDIQIMVNNKADADHIHTEYSKTGHTHSGIYAEYEHKHNYYDLEDLPTIPSIDGLATKEELETKADKEHTHDEYLKEHQDLSSYALKTDIPTVPTKTSELTNDSGFITDIPLEYVTESELDAKGYLTSTSVTRIELVDELPTTQEYGVLYIVKAGE